MATIEVERTAVGAGMMRALESHAPRPLFDDRLSARFLTGWVAVVVRRRALRWLFLRLLERAGPGFYGAVVCRTRAIDDACREALATGAEQVVVLGAGMDTRPYRLAELRTLRVWEVDLPGGQRAKKAAVVRVLGALPAHVRYAPADLAKQWAGDVLAAAGADPGARTLVLCEAVSLYMPEDAVEEILRYAGTLAPGSRFVLTYLPRAVADDPRYAAWGRRLRWVTSYEPADLARRLGGYGLRVLADLGAEDHQEQVLRPAGRRLAVFPGERIVIAEKG